jgi:DNA polymerase III subunit gamma/tau
MDASQKSYRVLARKYRPTKFSHMVGQENAVQTLVNAFEQGRVAHAFIFTGIRGVGKTTTARLLARGLNCEQGPTPEPCGTCSQCQAFNNESHVDVIEVDAASRTGVEDVRELIEGVRYKPVLGKYKVYIIDEVHMLSRNAFNALLKTLEEPPAHVVFIFATTEIQKVPLTILSRCQRFDLRRVDITTMGTYFGELLKNEGATIEPEAMHLICRAAEGSVRDGQSLLDQALTATNGNITTDQVRNMLGLSNRSDMIQLFGTLMEGDTASALTQANNLYMKGADPLKLLQDLLDITHAMTTLKVAPQVNLQDLDIPQSEEKRCQAMAQQLSVPTLSYAWQILMKGLDEVKTAPWPKPTLEMVLIRLIHVTHVLDGKMEISAPRTTPMPAKANPVLEDIRPEETPQPMMAQSTPSTTPTMAPTTAPGSFEGLIELCQSKREALLASTLMDSVHVIDYQPGLLKYRLAHEEASKPLVKLGKLLREWTNTDWTLESMGDGGAPTIKEQKQHKINTLQEHPKIQEILKCFPGSKIETIH